MICDIIIIHLLGLISSLENIFKMHNYYFDVESQMIFRSEISESKVLHNHNFNCFFEIAKEILRHFLRRSIPR
jgi:hypothetical protein